MQLEIATGFYQSDSLPLSAQRCVNWIPIVPQANALNQRALFDVWGIAEETLSGDTIDGANRGAQVMDGVPYFVNGRKLYSISSTNVVTDHGAIIGAERVSMANNGQYLVIVVPGVRAYAFNNADSTLNVIEDADFITADTVSFKDGYFIFTASDGSVFFVSNLNDPFAYSALDFGSANVRPDKIVATHVNHNELFVCGDETIELFANIGGDAFPFQRVEGGNIQKGVYAKHSLVDFDGSFVFIGGEPNELAAVWRAGVEKISTSAIDNAIQKFSKEEISNAYAMTYAYGGNFFVAFTIESMTQTSKTFVYDATTSALSGERVWHERESGIGDKWRVTSIVNAYGKLLTGDSVDGRIGQMQRDVHSEYGDNIFRERVSKPFQKAQLPAFAGEFRLKMESGTGDITTEPQVEMSYSDDGGRSWSNGFWRTYGKEGDREKVPEWRRQGRVPRDRVLRFRASAKVKTNILRLDAEVE